MKIDPESQLTITRDNSPLLASEFREKPWFFCFHLLGKRSIENIMRQTDLAIARVSQGIFYALILSAFFAPLGNDQSSIQNRIGILYELTALCFIGMLNCIAIYPQERNVFYREYLDGYYSAYPFIFSYFSIAIPFIILCAFLMSLLITYAVGIKRDFLVTLQFTLIIFFINLTGESLGVIFCSLFQQIGFSINIVSAVISFFCIMAGYISLSMPQFIIDINLISPLQWSSYLLTNLAFRKETFDCSPSDSTCFTTGEEVLDFYNMNSSDPRFGMTYHYYMLAITVVVFLILAILSLRLRVWYISH